MKKYLFLIIASLSVFALSAQSSTKLGPDVITNTGTATKIIQATAGYSGAAIQVVESLTSGTGAGTVQLSGSNDGVNYVNIGSAYTITNVALQSTVVYIAAPLPQYIKILTT